MGYNLLINGVYWGYNPLTNHLDTKFLGHPRMGFPKPSRRFASWAKDGTKHESEWRNDERHGPGCSAVGTSLVSPEWACELCGKSMWKPMWKYNMLVFCLVEFQIYLHYVNTVMMYSFEEVFSVWIVFKIPKIPQTHEVFFVGTPPNTEPLGFIYIE